MTDDFLALIRARSRRGVFLESGTRARTKAVLGAILGVDRELMLTGSREPVQLLLHGTLLGAK